MAIIGSRPRVLSGNARGFLGGRRPRIRLTWRANAPRPLAPRPRAPSRPVIEPSRYHAVLADDPDSLERVRSDMGELAGHAGLRERAADVMLAIDELVANAREHGRPPIVVDAWADGRLVIEVSDGGQGFETEPSWPSRPPSPAESRGRGLWIVRQLADNVHVHTGPKGTRVRMELTHEPQIGA